VESKKTLDNGFAIRYIYGIAKQFDVKIILAKERGVW
jgi:hypothetical protein